MKLKHPVGFAGTVYRPGQEKEFEAAIAAAKKKEQPTPDLQTLAGAGLLDLAKSKAAASEESSAETGGEEVAEHSEPTVPKSAKRAKSAKRGK